MLAAALLLLAQEIPTITERVDDRAGLLSPAQARELKGLLEELERTDSTQVVVLTVQTTAPDSIEGFANRTFNQNKIGQANKNNGVLIVVAVKDRRCRIEVGYGLEGVLPDATCHAIVQKEMVARFKRGDMAGGVLAAARAVVGAVRGEYKAERSNVNVHMIPLMILPPAVGPFIFVILGKKRVGAIVHAVAAVIVGVSTGGFGGPALVVGVFMAVWGTVFFGIMFTMMKLMGASVVETFRTKKGETASEKADRARSREGCIVGTLLAAILIVHFVLMARGVYGIDSGMKSTVGIFGVAVLYAMVFKIRSAVADYRNHKAGGGSSSDWWMRETASGGGGFSGGGGSSGGGGASGSW